MEPPAETAPAVAGPDFDALVHRVEGRLIGYLRFRLGSGDDAEDLFQETMLAVHRHWHEVRNLENPEAWVFRVAHNLAVNHSKRRAVQRRATLRLAAPGIASGPTRLEQAETGARVQAALDLLPPDEREAVCLKVWAGCTWVEIARLMGVSEDKAARLFARGLKTIAGPLADLAPGGSP